MTVAQKRHAYIEERLVPFVRERFERFGLQSAMWMVAQYWDDGAYDEMHNEFVWSENAVPNIDSGTAAHNAYLGESAIDWENLPINQLGQQSIKIGDKAWLHLCNTKLVSFFAQYCKEDVSQDLSIGESHVPCVLFRKVGGTIEHQIVGRNRRPWLEGVVFQAHAEQSSNPAPRSELVTTNEASDNRWLKGRRDSSLEQAIRERPDDDQLVQVYGDWLAEHGNCWAELIALQSTRAATQDRPSFQWPDLVEPFRKTATPPLVTEEELELTREASQSLAADSADSIHINWWCGLARGVVIPRGRWGTSSGAELLERVLAHPLTLTLRELGLGDVEEREDGRHFDDELKVMCKHDLTLLDRLALGFSYVDSSDSLSIRLTNELYAAAPNLRALELQADEIELGSIELPELKRLEIRGRRLPSGVFESIVSSSLEQLESLTLWLGADDEGGLSIAKLVGALSPSRFPSLRTLGLMNSGAADLVVRELIASPIVPQLRSLSFAGGTLGQQGADWILGSNGAFGDLEMIDLRGNSLVESSCRFLEAELGPRVRLGHQSSYVGISSEEL